MALLACLLSHPLDWWVKAAQVVQGFSTPVIAFIIGVISVGIQRQQSRIQKQQAQTNRRQYRLSLFKRRMKVFDSMMGFINLVNRDAEIRDMEPLFELLRATKEHKLLFGEEIGKLISELHQKGSRLRTYYVGRTGGPIADDIAQESNVVEWLAQQTAVAEQLFLRYLDFRQPY
jgi:hypothetical protein